MIENLNNSKRSQCKFNLFVVLKPGVPSVFKDLKREWCFRGDKFCYDDRGMIRSLLNLMKKSGTSYRIMELYDTTRAPEYELQVILKIQDNQVVINLLQEYASLLINFILPEPL